MASIVQQQQGRDIWNGLKQALKDLDFISWGFSWLFMFASRIAEPLMTLSVLYIIIEAGVPVVHSDGLHNLSVAIMIASPEIMLPGSFVMASQARTQGNERKATLLYVMCWIFVFITIVTLVSLFIFKLDATWFSVITCARCAAGVGYSILIRVITHSQDEQVSPEQITQQVREEMSQHYEAQAQHLRQQLEQIAQQNMQLLEQLEDAKVSQVVDNKVVFPPVEDETTPSTDTPFVDDITAYLARQERDTGQSVAVSTDRETEPRAKVTRKLSAKTSTKPAAAKGRESARAKALRIARKHPGIGPTELAQKAQITRQYASTILKEIAS